MARWWSKKRRNEEELSPSDDHDREIYWSTLIQLAKDVSAADALVAARMLQASTDIDEFISDFARDEPSHRDVFTLGFDREHEVAPFLCFDATLSASGYLSSIDGNCPLSDIVFIFNHDADHRGIPQLTDREVAALNALEPKDQRQTDLFFNDVASALDEACAGRNRRLLCWDNGSDSYAYFIVTSECFSRWVDTSLHEYHRLLDASEFR